MHDTTCVITDVHGRLTELWKLLEQLPKGSQLIFLGDYIDRGSQSAEVVELVRSLPDAVCLRGNHEDMMCNPDTMGGTWMANGGNATLESYKNPLSGEIDFDRIDADAAWFRMLPRFYRDEHRVYVHAGVNPAYILEQQPEGMTQWYRYPKGEDVGYHGLHVVHGHTPGIVRGTHRTCLDGGKQLTCGVFRNDTPGGPVELLWA